MWRSEAEIGRRLRLSMSDVIRCVIHAQYAQTCHRFFTSRRGKFSAAATELNVLAGGRNAGTRTAAFLPQRFIVFRSSANKETFMRARLSPPTFVCLFFIYFFSSRNYAIAVALSARARRTENCAKFRGPDALPDLIVFRERHRSGSVA